MINTHSPVWTPTAQPPMTANAHSRHDAVAALYHEHAAALFQFALALLGARDEADDAVQELFHSVIQKPHLFFAAAHTRHYLLGALRNVCANRVKRRARDAKHASFRDALFLPETDGREPVDPQLVEKLNDAMRDLPLEQREALALRVLERMDYETIGRLGGCGAKTAQSRVRLALEKLKELLS